MRCHGCVGLSDLLDLVLPEECAGCRRAGRRWCARCDAALEHCRLPLGAGEVQPCPPPPGLPRCHAWGRYAGPLQAAVRAWKDGGRRDLSPMLGALLSHAMVDAVVAAGWAANDVLIVPVPSSGRARRERGDVPLHAVAAEATRRARARQVAVHGPAPALSHARAVADQAALGARGRAGNLRGAMSVAARWGTVIRGRPCLVVDDVVTTGSTLAEAARALRAAGAADVAAATVAATVLRAGPGPAPVGPSRFG